MVAPTRLGWFTMGTSLRRLDAVLNSEGRRPHAISYFSRTGVAARVFQDVLSPTAILCLLAEDEDRSPLLEVDKIKEPQQAYRFQDTEDEEHEQKLGPPRV